MGVVIKGIAQPYRFTARGYPEPAVDVGLLNDSIEYILETGRGERVRRPNFGSDLKRILFANITKAAKVRAQVEARRAIEEHERRVVVDAIIVTDRGSKIEIEVVWRPRGALADSRSTSVGFDVGVG